MAFIQRSLLGQPVSTNVWHIASTEFGGTSMTIDTAKSTNWTLPMVDGWQPAIGDRIAPARAREA